MKSIPSLSVQFSLFPRTRRLPVTLVLSTIALALAAATAVATISDKLKRPSPE